MQNLAADVQGEGEGADEDADDVDDVVAIVEDLARAAAVLAPLLLRLQGAREGLCHEGPLEQRNVGLRRRWVARRRRERVDQLQHKESRERAAKVRDTIRIG